MCRQTSPFNFVVEKNGRYRSRFCMFLDSGVVCWLFSPVYYRRYLHTPLWIRSPSVKTRWRTNKAALIYLLQHFISFICLPPGTHQHVLITRLPPLSKISMESSLNW